MEIGHGCVYIDSQGAPRNGLVIATNPNGTFDVAVVTDDPKRRTRAGSADWGLVFDRILHVEAFPAKLKARLNTENEQAMREGRDADFDDIGQEVIPESVVEGWHRLHLETLEDGRTQKVVSVQLFGSEHDELPEEYELPEPPAGAKAVVDVSEELEPVNGPIAAAAAPEPVADQVQQGEEIPVNQPDSTENPTEKEPIESRPEDVAKTIQTD